MFKFKKFWAALHQWIDWEKNIGRFFAYFIVGNMLVAGLFGALLYVRSASSLETQTIEANQNMLLQLNKSTDLLLNQVDQYLNRLSLDPFITEFIQRYKGRDLVGQFEINAAMDNNLLLNQYINAINIFYRKESKVYSINCGVRDLTDFPDRRIFAKMKHGGPNFYNWLPTRKLLDEKSGNVIEVITIIKPVPLGSFDPIAVAAVNIDEGFLRNSMNSIITKEQNELLVVDEQGRFISSNRRALSDRYFRNKPYLRHVFEQKSGSYPAWLNHQKVLISFVSSERYGWKYISIVPYRAIDAKIVFFRDYALIVSLLAIALGIAVALFFSNKISRPIRLIAGLFKNGEQQPGENDVLKYIEKSVNRLVEQNEHIEKAFREHLPVLRNNFLTSLLTGCIADSREIEARFQYYGIDFAQHAQYIVFLISLGNYRGLSGRFSERQLNLFVISLMEVLNNLPGGDYQKIVVNTKAPEIAMLFALPSPDDELSFGRQIELIGAAIHQAVQSHVQGEFAIAAGTPKPEIARIADSYQEALEALHYRVLKGKSQVIWFEEIQDLKAANYPYPYAKEKALINHLKQGDIESALRLNHDLFKFFTSCSGALGDAAVYFHMQLLSSTIQCALEMGINIESLLGGANPYRELLKCTDIVEVQDWFVGLFKELSEQVQNRKNAKNQGVIESMVKYIREHYDQDLGLKALSQRVFLSVPYLSAVFREEYGKPLKQFINEVRIEKAKQFLADPNYQIAEVAEKVGYDKVHAFLRLFKEYTGMTPGQYRKTIIFHEENHHSDLALH